MQAIVNFSLSMIREPTEDEKSKTRHLISQVDSELVRLCPEIGIHFVFSTS